MSDDDAIATFTLRIPQSVLARVDALRATMRSTNPLAGIVSRNDLIGVIISAGVDALAAGAPKPDDVKESGE